LSFFREGNPGYKAWASLFQLHGEDKSVALDDQWAADDDLPFTDIPSCLYHAAALGFPQPLRNLIQDGGDVNKVGGRWHYPLLAAIRSGNDESVRVLLEAGAFVDVATEYDGEFFQEISIDGDLELGRDCFGIGSKFSFDFECAVARTLLDRLRI
jgi:hypothetical protein